MNSFKVWHLLAALVISFSVGFAAGDALDLIERLTASLATTSEVN